MTDGKLGRITAFSKEQGFGRVAVAEEGEFVFDASVAQCATDTLTVGTDVLVCTGPGRVAGQRKVTQLWRGDTPPAPAPPASGVERFENFGPYSYLLPPFWPHGAVNHRDPVWTSSTKLNDVQCVLLAYVGGASDATAKADLIATRSAAARATRCDAIDRCSAFPSRDTGSTAVRRWSFSTFSRRTAIS